MDAITTVSGLTEEILEISRQNQMNKLTPWFAKQLDQQIAAGNFPHAPGLAYIGGAIVDDLSQYRRETNKGVVVLGMSGGVDSALTAALYREAGFRVIGVTMPINQVESETARGVEACSALGIEHQHVDLGGLYDAARSSIGDDGLNNDDHQTRIRLGNIRARLRMMTLYNLASSQNGFVASTDNLSELAAGFWTLNGDVGDVSPIQSLTKSWEVPSLARLYGVPEATVLAKPTDGLGISDGDEAQLGCSYLEWDIMVFAIMFEVNQTSTMHSIRNVLNITGGLGSQSREGEVFDSVTRRMSSTWFKRFGTINISHPLQKRYAGIERIDNVLFVPKVVKGFSNA